MIDGTEMTGSTPIVDTGMAATTFGQWEPSPSFNAVPFNTSGIKPIEFKVLILPDPVEEVSKGGIIMPVEKITKDEYATTTGRIVAVAHAAFAHVTDDEWGGDKPKVGDHVVITKYCGFRMKGPKDGVNYLVVRGEDIHAKIED